MEQEIGAPNGKSDPAVMRLVENLFPDDKPADHETDVIQTKLEIEIELLNKKLYDINEKLSSVDNRVLSTLLQISTKTDVAEIKSSISSNLTIAVLAGGAIFGMMQFLAR